MRFVALMDPSWQQTLAGILDKMPAAKPKKAQFNLNAFFGSKPPKKEKTAKSIHRLGIRV